MKLIHVIGVNDAARIMTEHGYPMTPQKLRLGLQQKVFPFGVAINMKQWDYDIFEWQLLQYLDERAGDVQEA